MSTFDFAGFWLRLVAFIIDSIILSVVYLILLQPFFSSIFPVGYDEWDEAGLHGSSSGFSLWASSYLGYGEFFLLGVAMVYHSLMESSKYQASLGKLALELKVIDADGERLSFSKALLRNAAKIISSLPMMIGYIMAGLTKKKQALHDIIADTLVVKK